MESENLHPHNHHLQEQFAGYYSSLLLQPEYYKFSSINNMQPNFIVGSWTSSRSSNICQELMGLAQKSPSNELICSKIKEEMPQSYHKLEEIIHSSPCKIESAHDSDDHNHHFLFNNTNSFFSGHGHHNHHRVTELPLLAGELLSPNSIQSSSSASNRYGFSHSNSLDLNFQALDTLNPTCDGYSFTGHLKDSSSSSSNKAGIERKRRSGAGNIPDTKNLADAKKHKSLSQLSCSPSQVVKKEKQREKIANLQRLVAPYGKTDTASVLTDTIGYIQFLHDQVKTLTVPYMRSSQSRPTRTVQERLIMEDGKEQPKRDLSSGGLSLMPISLASFIFDNYGHFGI